jgi:seryl-tRNA synthetase
MNKNVITTLAARIGKKSLAIEADRTKVKNLRAQIEMYEASIVKSEAGIEQKTEELDELLDLRAEAEKLLAERDELQAYTDALVKKFNAIPWRRDLEWEEKIESTDYADKIEERQIINVRLEEITKAANKIYYRR